MFNIEHFQRRADDHIVRKIKSRDKRINPRVSSKINISNSFISLEMQVTAKYGSLKPSIINDLFVGYPYVVDSYFKENPYLKIEEFIYDFILLNDYVIYINEYKLYDYSALDKYFNLRAISKDKNYWVTIKELPGNFRSDLYTKLLEVDDWILAERSERKELGHKCNKDYYPRTFDALKRIQCYCCNSIILSCTSCYTPCPKELGVLYLLS